MKTVISNEKGNFVFLTKFAYTTTRKSPAVKSKTVNLKQGTEYVTQRETLCYIKVGIQGEEELLEVASGISSCDSRDNFEKAVGRAIAYQRAMKNLFSSEKREKYGLTSADFMEFTANFKRECSTSAHLI